MPEITRAEIAASLAGVAVDWDGATHELAPSQSQPQALAAWQAWPDWQAAEWLSAGMVERTWAVYVILPAPDPQAWTSATDAVLNAVRGGR